MQTFGDFKNKNHVRREIVYIPRVNGALLASVQSASSSWPPGVVLPCLRDLLSMFSFSAGNLRHLPGDV